MRKQGLLSAAVSSDARSEAVPVCFHLHHGADINTTSFNVLDSCLGCVYMCVCYSRGGLNSDDLCARVLMSTSRHPCLFGRVAKDFSDRLMVAEQRYRRHYEGRWGIGRQVPPPSHRVGVPASLEPAGAGGSRLSDGGTGGSESQRDKDSTKTGHRLTVLFFSCWLGGRRQN